MYHMFYYCEELEVLNLCSFDTSNVTTMEGMFYQMPSLKYIYVGDKWKSTDENFFGIVVCLK